METLTLEVQEVQDLTANVYRVRLDAPEGTKLVYDAGQYLEIVLPTGETPAFSIASACDGKSLELHIQYLPERENSKALLALLQSGEPVQVNIPKGDCILRPTEQDHLLLIAAGTGFSQMKAMLEHAFANPTQYANKITLYWAARSSGGHYLEELVKTWDAQYANFEAVILAEQVDTTWSGRKGHVVDALLADHTDFSDCEVYVSGSPGMVYAVQDALEARELFHDRIHSDVFAYAPRTELKELK
ncbi:CDP-4-dehydro-6-deoxyglucose reductase [Allopseudospirillum japonicum]|uniref:CDP-4-dehydro-6-deoxyglucose reductase n=1 Tax=Allopseudospirillum japonicum TaxID=64971 RepID=A0A1H6RGM7_9GAMM|nr:NAD(P)H-flavin reductase [Allopseudospirillum japonicum]SEI50332.1 CDP-4-dehydro-6-deoxyglucose reductase [Allopseudospirillum japonicum]